ncbi:hypothetical protein Mapa_016092 [Marchantia paleacea]|nr:hypothetical protein Mapa_016092 [Marchantia paleacea]
MQGSLVVLLQSLPMGDWQCSVRLTAIGELGWLEEYLTTGDSGGRHIPPCDMSHLQL